MTIPVPCFMLLKNIVDTERASVVHWSECEICQRRKTPCDAGKTLTADKIGAMLAGTVFVDRTRGGKRPPCFDKKSSVPERLREAVLGKAS